MPERPKRQVAVSFRLDEFTKRLLEKVADRLGISKTDVVVTAIREKARKEKVK